MFCKLYVTIWPSCEISSAFGVTAVTNEPMDLGIRSFGTAVHHEHIYIIIIIIIIIIGIQPLGRFGQRPELSQATGVALVRCILGKFLGVGCQYFPPHFRRSHFRHQVPLLPS